MTFSASDHLNDLFFAHSSSLERGTTGAGVISSTPAPVTCYASTHSRNGASAGPWKHPMVRRAKKPNRIERAFWNLRAVVLAGLIASAAIAVGTIGHKAWLNVQNSIALGLISEGFGQ